MGAFTVPRFALLKANFMKVFRDQLDGAAIHPRAPPLIRARVRLAVFWNNVKKLEPQLTEGSRVL